MSLGRFRREVLIGVRPGGVLAGSVGGGARLGWPDDEGPPGPTLGDLVHPGRLLEVLRLIEGHDTAEVGRLPGTVRVRHGDGRWVPVGLEVEAHLDDPELRGWVVRLLPADDEHVATVSLPDRFELLAEVVTAGILTADADGQVSYANPASRELFWLADDALLGHGWLDAVHADDRLVVRATAERVRDRGTTELAEFRVLVNGIDRWLRARFNAIAGAAGRTTGWVAVLDDITTDRATAEELARQATHDPLTGLPNRLLLEDRLTQSIARSRRHRTALAVLFLDLDRFKDVNDRHGHQVGDQVLREVADRIRRVVRAEDTAARLGGDEFVVVAEGLSTDHAARVADRISSAVGAPIPVSGAAGAEDLALRVSIGVAWSEHLALGPAGLLEAADAAMYQAKRNELGLAFADLT